MKIFHFLFFLLTIGSVTQTDALYTVIGDILSFLINLSGIQTYIKPLYPDPGDLSHLFGYDFIIIGSSPSGCALANRLTENPDVHVLILENGEEASFVSDIPAVSAALQFTKYDYGYKTEPQPGFCRKCPNGTLQWPHGKALGGSSIINYMIYVRANRRDYDRWAAMGNPGWSYDDVLPYFKKLEDTHVKISDEGYRGKGGPLTVSDVLYRTKLVDVYVNACMEAGYDYVDYNGKEQMGISYIQATTVNGKRCSAEKAYLRPIRHRKNLKIQTNSRVTKILINEWTNTAYGVEYYHNNEQHAVLARKEVILSAGALNSPQVLMLSGIGPREHLEELGIRVIKNLPVGKKMYDHATFPGICYQLDQKLEFDLVGASLNPLSYVGLALGQGPFTSIGGVEAISYIKTNASTDPDPLYPDVELLFTSLSAVVDYGVVLRKMFNLPPDLYDELYKPVEGKHIYTVTPVVLHPKSFGYIKLRSKDPFDAPLYYPNFFSDPEDHDVETMLAGMREFQRINTMPALQKYGAKLVYLPVPGCVELGFDTDAFWKCFMRSIIASYYHQVATCKMGPRNDEEAVVGADLKVHGIENLRVVDTSVIPIPPSSHNVGPAYVIGEKAADMIKNHYYL